MKTTLPLAASHNSSGLSPQLVTRKIPLYFGLITLTMPVMVHAAETGNAPASTAIVSAQNSFNIPRQPLYSALNALAEQAKVQFIFTEEMVQGLSSPGVSGQLSTQEALKKVLEGSGLIYRVNSGNTITLEKKPVDSSSAPDTLPAVKVMGKAVDSTDPYNSDYSLSNASSATKTDTPIMETPFSVQVVPKQVLEDIQGVRSTDALDYVSGVYKASGSGDWLDWSTRRGFDNFPNGDYRDGAPFPLADFMAGGLDLANTERVEVLKGPASLLYGNANPGGVVNYITKKPLETPYYALQQQFGSYDYYRTTLDATGPINTDKTLLYRFNLAYKDANSFRDNVGSDRIFLAPTLTWNISPKTQVNFELEYDKGHAVFDRGIPAIGNRPANLPRERFLGEGNPMSEFERIMTGINWSHAFNDNWMLTHRFKALYIGADQISSVPTLTANNRTANRQGSFNSVDLEDRHFFFNTLNLTGNINTWGLKHTMLFGADHYRYSHDNLKLSPYTSTIDIYDPVYRGPTFATAQGRTPNISARLDDWFGFYFQDQIKLPFNLQMMAGFRYDNSISKTVFNGSESQRPRQDSLTPRGGLIWQPIQALSLYGSYSENFTGINSSGFAGTVLPPETAQQWEFGAKTELFDKRFLGTVAWYDLTKQNVAVFNGLTGFSEAIGEAQSAGLEVDAKGEIIPGLNMIASYAYTPEAIVTRGLASQIDQRLRGVPRHGGSLFTSYEFQSGTVQGLKLGGGAIIRSSQHTDPLATTAILPGYTTLNLLASYSLKVGASKMTTQLNVNNLLDKEYFPTSFGRNNIEVGSPRTFMGSIKFEY